MKWQHFTILSNQLKGAVEQADQIQVASYLKHAFFCLYYKLDFTHVLFGLLVLTLDGHMDPMLLNTVILLMFL